MKLEIERKFLADPAAIPAADRARGERLTQGYLAFAPTVRVRLGEPADGPARGWLTIKGPGGFSRAEFEYPIPADDARELLALCSATLAKVRYHVAHEGHTWDVDEFLGPHAPLWLAEVELAREDEAFARPPWAVRDVTDDPRYTNGALARAGRAP